MATDEPTDRVISQGVEAFGANVRRLRLQRGGTQEVLAELVGVHPTYVGGIERGERNPSLEKVIALARALQIDVRVLFDNVYPIP
jgi:transcriptional regulator with XRE-family HTH domain